jgi:hypothetical protein
MDAKIAAISGSRSGVTSRKESLITRRLAHEAGL